MRTILVTGGAGFIGGCFVRRMLNRSDTRVINLDALTYAGNTHSIPKPDGEKHVFVQGDIGDYDLVSGLLKQFQPAAVVNFAAESHVDRSIDGPMPFVETNVVGTCQLLEACKAFCSKADGPLNGDFRLLHVSTDEVYGSLGETGLFTETSSYAPNSPYSASKAASDHFVRAWHHTYHLPTIITNCSNNYGPYQFPEKLIPLMILNAINGKPLPIYGDGKNIRDWLYVDDHCSAIEAVVDRGVIGETYNIGGNCERTNLDVVHAICDAVRRRGLEHEPRELITYVEDRPGHDRRYAIDSTKIQRDLGWTPATSFDEGMNQTVNWYCENTQWIEAVSSGSYRQQRLGLGKKVGALHDA